MVRRITISERSEFRCPRVAPPRPGAGDDAGHSPASGAPRGRLAPWPSVFLSAAAKGLAPAHVCAHVSVRTKRGGL